MRRSVLQYVGLERAGAAAGLWPIVANRVVAAMVIVPVVIPVILGVVALHEKPGRTTAT